MEPCPRLDAARRGCNPTVLPDLLAPGLKIVFCGTAASAASAKNQAYYAGPGNAFWPTLYQVGFIPRPMKPQEYPALLDFGLGLTDLAKGKSGNDDALGPEDYDVAALKAKLRRFEPRIVAFTSKTAAKTYFGRRIPYGFAEQKLGPTQFYVLPSPSGAARGHWDVAVWQTLAEQAG